MSASLMDDRVEPALVAAIEGRLDEAEAFFKAVVLQITRSRPGPR